MAILPLTLGDIRLELDGRPLLEGINHRFERAAISVLLGHNGAGKTLLLKLCHGLLRPSAGRIDWHDPAHAQRPGVQAMVFQKPVLLRRSVRRNIEYVLKACRVPAAQRRRRVEQALEMARLSELAERPARRLSGGEAQRVALARAWAARAELLLLDEPCTYLDPGATHDVENIIRAFHDAGTKVIMATHDLAQARRLADEIVLMERGRIAETAPGETFFTRPASEAARSFLEGRLWAPDSRPADN